MNVFQGASYKTLSLNLNVISLYSSQVGVGLGLILVYGKKVKILEEQVYLLFKVKLLFQK